MKRLALLPLLFLMGAADCEPQPQPQGYCSGTEGVFDSTVANVKGFWNTIIGGFPAEDRNSTVYVSIVGTGSCSGTILNEHTVLTAGHCNGTNGYKVYLDPTKPQYFTATGSLIHPGYSRWSSQRGEPHDDLMLLYFDNVTLPGPFPLGYYGSESSEICDGLISQGWGQTTRSDAPPPPDYKPIPCPDGALRCLQESDYSVTLERETDIETKQLTWGGICFGDSGGPLYAQLSGQPGLHLAGVTSTTSSQNCVVGSTHVKAIAYKDWILANMR